MRLALLHLSLLMTLAGCTVWQSLNEKSKGGPKKADDGATAENTTPSDEAKPPAAAVAEPDEEEDEGDDEGGVKAITALIKQMNQALGQKKFDHATKLLAKAERRIERASDVTRSHPDFEDTEELVQKSRVRLEGAIERDRIERRNAAIDDLIRRGDKAIAQGMNLHAQLAARIPHEEDVTLVEEVLTELLQVQTSGQEFLDDPRYAEHSQGRDDKIGVLSGLRDKLTWQRDAAQSLQKPIDVAYAAATEAQKAPNVDAQIVGYQRAAQAFRSCVSRIGDLSQSPSYDAKTQVTTRLGTISLDETKKRCLTLAQQAQKGVDELMWKKTVRATVKDVNEVLAIVRSTTDVAEALSVNQKAVDILAICTRDLTNTEKTAGYDGNFAFETLLGNLNAPAFRKACEKERDGIARKLPGLQWRSTLGSLQKRLEELDKQKQTAGKATDARARVDLWNSVVGGMNECVERARSFAKAPGADKSLPIPTAFGNLEIGALEKECGIQKRAAEVALAQAMKDKEVMSFADTVRGDEKDLAKREGIPTRVENFAGGRVFFYDKPTGPGGKIEQRRYGFDQKGKRVDFWVEWRNSVVTVVSELARTLGPVREAPTGEKALKAVEIALPVLNACEEVLKGGQTSIGYDGAAVFNTALGKLAVPDLIVACVKEKKRLQDSIVPFQWRDRFEKLGKRLDETLEQIDLAQKSQDIDGALVTLSQALGGLQECAERAKALTKEPGADSKMKVATRNGALNLAAVEKACNDAQGPARRAADETVVKKRLATFLKSCRGDEAEVARREGIPMQIEQLKNGRVFVFAQPPQGKKIPPPKRVAFDNSGKRIDEKVLAASSGGQPVIVKPKDDGGMPDLVAIPR